MSLAPWKDVLQQALKKNRSIKGANYFQLATVTPSGRPANRTVVFRDWLAGTDRLTFITDSRSKKCMELQSNPYAEIAWWFPGTRDQFRLSAKLQIVFHTTQSEELQLARQRTWKILKDMGRQQFLWPHPGEPRQEGADDSHLFNPEASPEEVSSNFCLVVCDVNQVDHLSLKGNQRWLYTKEGGSRDSHSTWVKQYVNP